MLVLAVVAARLATGAIYTESNAREVYPPPWATFTNGIDGVWIPYGSYASGRPGVQYARVTSNLVGAVASMFGAFQERWGALAGPSGSSQWTHWSPPLGGTIDTVDYGGIDFPFLAPANSNGYESVRIADQLNRPMHKANMNPYVSAGDVNFLESTNSPLERCLASGLIRGADLRIYAASLFGGYSSDRLKEALAMQDIPTSPPMDSPYTNEPPWAVERPEDWIGVYATFSACTNDPSFFPRTTGFLRYDFTTWIKHVTGPNAVDAWGGYYFDSADSFITRLNRLPLPVTARDVLSVDTAMTSDDYEHWRNDSTRLDWKRLGIICEMLRNMEIVHVPTIEPSTTINVQSYDYTLVGNCRPWPISLPTPSAIGETREFAMQHPDFARGNETFETSGVATVVYAPTAQISPANCAWTVDIAPATYPIEVSSNTIDSIIRYYCRALDVTNAFELGEFSIELPGGWMANGPDPAYYFMPDYADLYGYVTNFKYVVTVEIEGNTLVKTGGVNQVSNIVAYDDNWRVRLDFREAAIDFSLNSLDQGSPYEGTTNVWGQTNFAASNNCEFTICDVGVDRVGSGDITNWLWEVFSSLQPSVTELSRGWATNCYIVAEDYDDFWAWEWNGSSNYIEFDSRYDDDGESYWAVNIGFDGYANGIHIENANVFMESFDSSVAIPARITTPPVRVAIEKFEWEERSAIHYTSLGDCGPFRFTMPATNFEQDVSATFAKSRRALWPEYGPVNPWEKNHVAIPWEWNDVSTATWFALTLRLNMEWDSYISPLTADRWIGNAAGIPDFGYADALNYGGLAIFDSASFGAVRTRAEAERVWHGYMRGMEANLISLAMARATGLDLRPPLTIGALRPTDTQLSDMAAYYTNGSVRATYLAVGMSSNTVIRADGRIVQVPGGLDEAIELSSIVVSNHAAEVEFPFVIGDHGWVFSSDTVECDHRDNMGVRFDMRLNPIVELLGVFYNMRSPDIQRNADIQ